MLWNISIVAHKLQRPLGKNNRQVMSQSHLTRFKMWRHDGHDKLKDHPQSILTSSEKRDVRDMALSAEDWFEVKELYGVLTALCESMTEL